MIEHYYVFYTVNGLNFFDRTCGTKEAAQKRVFELELLYSNAIYFEQDIPKTYLWYY